MEDGRYKVQFSAKVGGLARLVSDMETSATASGSVEDGVLQPMAYEHSWREDDDAEVAAITFESGDVTEAIVDPPPRRPERRVLLDPGDLENVIDLATAFVWPAPDGVGPESASGRSRFSTAPSATTSP